VMNDWVASASHSGGAIGELVYGNSRGPTGTFELFLGASMHFGAVAGRFPEYADLGRFRTAHIRPNGEGTHVNASNFADDAANSPPVNPETRLDTSPLTAADTDYVKQTTIDATAKLEYTMESIPDNAIDILGLNVGIEVAMEGGGVQIGQMNTRWYLSSTERTMGPGTVVMNGGTRRTDILGNGVSGWSPNPTAADVQSLLLRHGYDTDASPNVRLHEMWATVAYTYPAISDDSWDIISPRRMG
jgi:hypothetical protein